jgi:hypothetical protein
LLRHLVDQIPEFLGGKMGADLAEALSDLFAHSFFPASVRLSKGLSKHRIYSGGLF